MLLQAPILLFLVFINEISNVETLNGKISSSSSFSGWYNNLFAPNQGTKGNPLWKKFMKSHINEEKRDISEPNPRFISNAIFRTKSGTLDVRNRTLLFAIFSQFIQNEIVDIDENSCPNEVEKIKLAKSDKLYSSNFEYLPYVRVHYKSLRYHTRCHPNQVTSWIDGSAIYGSYEIWNNCLREFKGGRLCEGKYGEPCLNAKGIPLRNRQSYRTKIKLDLTTLWAIGNRNGHENPPLLAISIVWFRYHNLVARSLEISNPNWSDEDLFTQARIRTIAALQNIVFYEWLPALLNEPVPEYEMYDGERINEVTNDFAIAMRFWLNMLPTAFIIRDRMCVFKGKPQRFCNTYWESQNLIRNKGLENILLGMSSQVAEKLDDKFVEDVIDCWHGPLHSSRQDALTMSILLARDIGLTDFNNIKKSLNHTQYRDFKAFLQSINRLDILEVLNFTYSGNFDELDTVVGALLENGNSGEIGKTFKEIIKEQFIRLRDGDRFWFENIDNKLLNKDEIEKIKSLKFSDILAKVSIGLKDKDYQENVFYFSTNDPCPQQESLKSEKLEKCSQHENYDYFRNSEIYYIISFAFLFTLPFILGFIAFVLVKYFKRSKAKNINKMIEIEKSIRGIGQLDGYECVNQQQQRPVTINLLLNNDNQLEMKLYNQKRKMVRKIVINVGHDQIYLTETNTYGHCGLYLKSFTCNDVYLLFESLEQRRELVDSFKSKLKSFSDMEFSYLQVSMSKVFDTFISNEERKRTLTVAFKNCFMKDLEETGVSNDVKERMHLSRSELSENLGMRADCEFIKRLFRFGGNCNDSDGGEFLSLSCILDIISVLCDETNPEKMRVLFNMYDIDNDGSLTQDELKSFIKSLMELSVAREIDEEETNNLVAELFGITKENISIEEFQDVFPNLTNASLTLIDKNKTTGLHRRVRSKSLANDKTKTLEERFRSVVHSSIRMKYTRRTFIRFRHFIENKRQHIFYLLLFFGITAVVFAERFYYYLVSEKHKGLLNIMSYGICVTRGAAAAMSFTFCLLPLTMCRNCLTFLRDTFVRHFLPIDSAVPFHKVCAWTAVYFTIMHVLGYCFNLYNLATQPFDALCVFDELVFKDNLETAMKFWLFENLIGITGILLCIIVSIIYVFSVTPVRRHCFALFWNTHKLIYPLYFLTILHGVSKIVQNPYFPYYLCAPAIIFALDKTVALTKRQRATMVLRCDHLPSNVVKLEIKKPPNFSYRSGQYVYLNCPKIGESYHPFTISSAPHEPTINLHIRSVGPWTYQLPVVFDCDSSEYPPVIVDGPYGGPHEYWKGHEVCVLIAGGVGITPYSSVIKDLVYKSKLGQHIKCKKVHIIWVTSSQYQSEWILDMFKECEEKDVKNILDINIFITQFYDQYDLRTSFLFVCEDAARKSTNKSLITGLKARTHFGRPNFDKLFNNIAQSTVNCKQIGVFSCGPPGLSRTIDKSCHRISRIKGNPNFSHLYDNF